jgi:GNAT superfamily N-acetyltransferase
MSTRVRALSAADAPAVEAFLREHADSSLFLRSNLAAVGIVDRGELYHGTWAAAFEDERIVALAAHAWNGNVVLQAPVALPAVVREAVARSNRSVGGLVGPWAQLVAARSALRLDGAAATFCSRDDLFALPLEALVVPSALAEGRVQCRSTRDADLDLAAEWRVGYRVELLGATDGPVLRRDAREEVTVLHAARASWMLEHDGLPLAYSAFNARLPDVVQVGGVWTPRALRSRGYARAVVAGSLLAARAAGVGRAALFTGEDNRAARRAYLALGFTRVGDYGLVLFAQAATT